MSHAPTHASGHAPEGTSSKPFIPGDGDPAAAPTAVVLFVGFVLVYLCVVGLQTLFYVEREQEYVKKQYGVPPEALVSARAEAQAHLKEYAWIDREQGVVAISIDRAMELVVREESVRARLAAGTEN